jgi:hypothetical protein
MNKPYALNVLATALLLAFAAPGQAVTIDLATAPDYASLQYSGASVTTITGIRDRNITGNYTLDGGNTGGLLFDNVLSSSTASPYPVATANQSNYPGSVASTPYGPSFGSPSGILRGVGSFKVAGATYDQGYLWDGATGVGTTLLPSTLTTDPILFTIAHSNFGNQVVGNYDTQLDEGQSFIYNIADKTYSSVPLDGASFHPTQQITEVASNTAYGVYNNVIAGGYTGKYGGTPGTYAYIHNQGNGKTYTFSSPSGSIVSHFEGITSAGQPGVYNMVVDAVDAVGGFEKAYIATVDLNRIDPATDQPYITWTEIKVSDKLTSANSLYQGNVIGVYVDGGITYAYYADVADTIISVGGVSTKLYNPTLVTNGATSTVSGGGADIINNGSLVVAGADGIQSGSNCGYKDCTTTAYGGVISNYGTVAVNGGTGSSAVLMQGTFGTLVNYGTLSAADGDYALRTDSSADGSLVVNGAGGVIDGQVSVLAGPYVRFENSGTIKISAAGAGVVHAVSGTFVQTDTGLMSLRVSPSAADQWNVDGTAKVAGTLNVAAAEGTYSAARHTLVTASDGLSGTFGTYTTNLTAAHKFTYDSNNLYLDVFAFSTADTQASVNQAVSGVQQSLAVQNASLVNSFFYDCDVFDSRDVCVSAGARYTSSNGDANTTAALLIAAYRFTPNFRLGAYVDQSLADHSTPGVNISSNIPLLGLFGVWQSQADGLGLAVKVSAAYGRQGADVTRQSINGTEAGEGSTKLTGQGAQVMTSYGLRATSKTVFAPYLGLRYTQGKTDGYNESASVNVTAPLSFGGVSTDLTTIFAGIGVQHQLTDAWTVSASAGVETDLNNPTNTVTVEGLNQLADVSYGGNTVQTRAVFSAGVSFAVTKTQYIGLNYIYRQSPYQGINTNSVFLNYTIGF